MRGDGGGPLGVRFAFFFQNVIYPLYFRSNLGSRELGAEVLGAEVARVILYLATMSELRNFVFTLNNPVAGEIDIIENWDQVTYLVYGKEKGEEGTEHFQGYAELKVSKKFSTVKNKMPRAHIEKRYGTADQAAAYCKKDGDFKEIGEISQQGKRTDLDTVIDLVKTKKRMRDVMDACPREYIKFHRGIEKLQKGLIEPRNGVPEVKVWWGPTGSGKTMRAKEWLGSDHWTWAPANGKWFDGYEGQEAVLFDEFRGQLPFGQLLNLLDRYDCSVEFKGGMCQFRGLRIAITSPKPPCKWYKDLDEDDRQDQLLRRITFSEQTGHMELE